MLVRKLTQLIKIINAEGVNILLNFYSKKPYKLDLIKLNYGDCSSTVECTTVARETRVRLPSFALIQEVEKEVNMRKKDKEKRVRKILDIIWRIFGGAILILIIYSIILTDIGRVDDVSTLFLTAVIASLFYVIISAIIFLPKILIKFFRKINKK